jgi:hypothetical protein
MVVLRSLLFAVVVVSLCAGPVRSEAQGLSGYLGIPQTVLDTSCRTGTECGLLSPGLKKFFNSYTSYQFPNPFPPYQDPLSRLEFPVDQWFAGIKGQYSGGWWSLMGEAWTNVSRLSTQKMQDSDWDDDANPSQKTIFSESACRLNRGWLVDLGASLGNPVRRFFNLRPILGYRYEYFFFTTYDGYQTELGGQSVDLPGDGIEFRQTFYHFYFGGSLHRDLNLPIPQVGSTTLRCYLQLDYALIRGNNEDLHLLRLGNRVTEQNTSGHCWHLLAALSLANQQAFSTRIELDLKRSITHGGHQLTNSFFALNFSFDGSRVWSDQLSLTAVVEIPL